MKVPWSRRVIVISTIVKPNDIMVDCWLVSQWKIPVSHKYNGCQVYEIHIDIYHCRIRKPIDVHSLCRWIRLRVKLDSS